MRLALSLGLLGVVALLPACTPALVRGMMAVSVVVRMARRSADGLGLVMAV